eukprot:CAMPEP_0194336718 /NCGR_PEP_ID=MMETSP0171-20130528/73922_1 /TAXON_ID=218684 /ORGANISM="Corethron pennatum, Strain L29A3" /LENGTH=33 /DNA_ID= /DNA_START= /DNA_END= /DNA_ORIENTATION=
MDSAFAVSSPGREGGTRRSRLLAWEAAAGAAEA